MKGRMPVGSHASPGFKVDVKEMLPSTLTPTSQRSSVSYLYLSMPHLTTAYISMKPIKPYSNQTRASLRSLRSPQRTTPQSLQPKNIPPVKRTLYFVDESLFDILNDKRLSQFGHPALSIKTLSVSHLDACSGLFTDSLEDG